jgi:carbon-monoxide dehydrogenase medium subunit
MKPAPFAYYAPTTIEEAVVRLAEHGWEAKVLAGGQSLVPLMNFRLAQPSVIVDLNNIAELSYIRPARDGGVLVGAMTRQRHVERDPLIAERVPLIHETMPRIAYPQVRTRGTFGGSLAHADPSAELVAATVALRGHFRLRGKTGERWVPAEEFFTGLFATALEPDELLVEIALPPLPARGGWAVLEVTRRHHDFALVGVTAAVRLDRDNRCQEVRLVYFSVGDGPVEAHQAAQMLVGQEPSPEAIRAAAEMAGEGDMDPSSDINASAEFRRHLAKVLGRQALERAFERARGG